MQESDWLDQATALNENIKQLEDRIKAAMVFLLSFL